eukprot:s568_g27.t1
MLWPSGGALVEEYETLHGKLAAADAFSLHAFWTTVSGRSGQEAARATAAVVQDRQSSILIHAAPVHEAPERPKIVTYRQMMTTGALPVPPVLAAAAASDPHAREKALKDQKVDALFQILLEEVLDLEELGLSLEQIQDPGVVQQLKETVMAQPSQLSAPRLGALASSFRRWKKFAAPRQYSIRKPTPLQLAEFFKEVSRGGPTAAAALWQSLRWFEDRMGMKLGVHHFLVKPFQFLPTDYSAVPAAELQPWEFANLVLWARGQRGTNLMILAFLLQTTVSCVRFEHIQRSSWTAHHEGWTEFWCQQGKKRVRGARPGYAWCCPEIAFQGFSLLKILTDFMDFEATPNVPFLWPALALQSDDFFDVTESTPFIGNKPMSRSRFLELLRGALVQIGVPPADAGGAGYNRLRRFMPTLANCVGLEGPDLQAIGSWVEVPAGGGPNPRVKSRACWLMGRHYGGNQCHQSALVKRAILQRFWAIFRKKLGDLAMTEVNLLARNAWTWEEFTATNATMEPLEFGSEHPPPAPLAAAVIDADSALDPALMDQPSEAVEVSESFSEEEDGSSTTSSSASDVTADGEDLENIPPLEETVEGMRWLRQGTKTHLVRSRDEAHRYVPWCRDSAFSQDARADGVGFATCTKATFCKRCLARLPRGAYTAIADLCGWAH